MKKYLLVLLIFLFPAISVVASMEIGEYDLNAAKGIPVRIKKPVSGCSREPFILYPGSLKHNIERLAESHCWPVVKWTVDSDFNWAGSSRGTLIHASTLQDALRKVLEKYPLQAQFYMGNRVLAIVSRTLK